MAAIGWEDVVAEAPEMADTDTRAQTLILAIVNGTMGPDPAFFGGEDGPVLKMMRCMLAAHMASPQDVGTSAGPVTSERAGSLARTYASPQADLPFQETAYGRAYWVGLSNSAARIGFAVTWGC